MAGFGLPALCPTIAQQVAMAVQSSTGEATEAG
jgi:hypothetical protein